MSTVDQAALMIEFKAVHCRNTAGKTLLNDLNLSVKRGELVLIYGPDDAGKTALLRLCAAMEKPASGTIKVSGQDLSKLRSSAVLALRRSIGIALDDPLLLTDQDALANVMLPALICGLSNHTARERAHHALRQTGFETSKNLLQVRQLTSFERQQVALARAIVNQPALLLVDQLISRSLELSQPLIDLLLRFSQAGVTVLATASTTIVHSVLPNTSTRCLLLAEGRLRAADVNVSLNNT